MKEQNQLHGQWVDFHSKTYVTVILISDQKAFKLERVIIDTGGHYLLFKGRIYQEVLYFFNINILN